MRIAALYDIHGNVPALEAVLADVAAVDIDVVVIGGDVVAGPWPAQTLDLLEHAAPDALWVRGNGDRELRRGEEGRAPKPVLDWVRAQLADDAAIERLASLPLAVELDVEGLGDVLFCHATPRNDFEIRTVLSPDDRWFEVLAGVTSPVVVCGHTHVQFDRTVGSTRIVNAGSVGMAYEDAPGAYWALIGPDVELKRSNYDVEAALAAIGDSGYPDEWPRATAAEASEYFESVAYD